MMERSKYLESVRLAMLSLPLLFLQDGTITTTLTISLPSLILAVPGTKKHAFIARVEFWHIALKGSAGCLRCIHPLIFLIKKIPILLDATKCTDKILTFPDSLAARSSYVTSLSEKPRILGKASTSPFPSV